MHGATLGAACSPAREAVTDLVRRLTCHALALVWALVLIDLCFPHPALRASACAGLVLFILLVLPRASLHIRVLCLLVVGASIAIAARSGNWGALYRGFESSIVFGAFLPTILLLRATAEQSAFVAAMRNENAQWRHARRCSWALDAAHALSAILSAGALGILRPMLPHSLPAEQRAELAESAVRGLGLAVCWSPFFVASAIAGQLVPGVRAWQTIVIGLALATIGWTVSHLMFFRGANLGGGVRAIRPLLIPIGLCVALVALMSAATRMSGLEAIVVLMPLICGAYLGMQGAQVAADTFGRVFAGLGGLADEIIIMSVALVLGTAVKGLALDGALFAQAGWLAHVPVLLIGAEVAFLVVAGVCGLHPMIGAALILPLAGDLNRGIADAVLAQVVVLGWALSSTVAIWSMPVPVAGKLFDVPIRRLASGRNAGFVLAFGACASVALAGLNHVLLR